MSEVLYYTSPIGTLKLCFDEEALVSLSIGEPGPQEYSLIAGSPAAQAVCAWLDAYFAGLQPQIGTLPLRLHGTAFQQKVWDHLWKIPYGKNTTYGQIAKMIAIETGKQKMSAQAVGQAVGANPIGIIIPCHRVLGSQNQLTGYAGGLDRKIWLLDHEKIEYKK